MRELVATLAGVIVGWILNEITMFFRERPKLTFQMVSTPETELIDKEYRTKTSLSEHGIEIYNTGKNPFILESFELCYKNKLLVDCHIVENAKVLMPSESFTYTLMDMILFKNSKGIQISYSLDLSNSTVLNQYQDTTENILGQFFSADKKYLIIYSEKYIQIWTLTTMSDMYEIKFYESIHKVLYASDKLYILCTNNIFQIYDLITRKLITQNNELFNYVERRIYDFYISPKGKYIFVRVEINKYEVYDAQTLKHLQSFKGDFISFNSTETSFIIGYNYMEEARANAHRIRLQEWRRNKKNTCIFECTSNLSEEIFLRASEKLEIPIKDIYSIDGLPYFNITNAIYIPNSNILLIRLYCVGADRRVLLLLNSDTNEIENIIEPKFENSNYNNGIDTYILNTLSTDFTSKCVPIINLYTLEQFELDHIELTHDVDDIKEAAYNLLFNLHDIVIIINVKTRKYMVVPFLPNLYVKSSVLKNIQLPEYKDTKTFFNVLEMYGAKIT